MGRSSARIDALTRLVPLFLACVVVCASSCRKPAVAVEVTTGEAPAAGVVDAPERSAGGALALSARLAAADATLSQLLAPRADGFERDGVGATSRALRAAGSPRLGEIGVRLPALASDAREVGLGRFERFRLRLTPEGASGAPLAVAEGRAVYEGAFTSTDVVVAATSTRFEELLVLHGEDAPAELSWQVETPPGLTGPRSDGAGGLAWVDAKGEEVLRMPRPFALDAGGLRRDAALSYEDGRLTVRLDRRGLSYPVLLDPGLETAVWSQWSYEGRKYPALAYDSVAQQVLTFGGLGATGTVLSDTWGFGATSMTLFAPAHSPSKRMVYGLAYDSKRNRTVLFGGYDFFQTTEYGDTWEWNGTDWTQIMATGPQGREQMGMAYDSARGVTVLFGGSVTGVGNLSDTWEWDGTVWTQRSPAHAPPPRSALSLAYDSGRGVTVLFGGNDLSDTWEYDGTDWQQRSPATVPPGRTAFGMAYDGARAVTVMWGGSGASGYLTDTWEWNGTDWTQRFPATTPLGRDYFGMAYDAHAGRTVLLGGENGNARPNDRWEWDGTNWALAAETPPSRGNPELVYDAARAKTVLFGGWGSNPLNDTWEWDGRGWTESFPANSPAPRSTGRMAYDSVHGVTILHGGTDGTQAFDDSWTWDGTNWTDVSPAAPAPRPPQRYSAALAYDAKRGKAVLFGGTAWTTFTDLADTWEWDGTSWTQRTPANSPPARNEHVLAYDQKRGVTVLFGGYVSATNGRLGDTWEWDGTNWAQRLPVTSPPPRYGGALAYDSARQKTVLFGGDASPLLADVWEWDGASWVQLSSSISPSPRRAHAMSFDATRKRMVTFAGFDTANLGDTWELHVYGANCTAASQCDTPYCVDGVCCEVASCTGTCVGCDGTTPGQCSTITNAVAPASCPGASMCGPTGLCGPANGQTCATGADCASTFCVDGVCCAEAVCNGACVACNLPTSPGVCSVVMNANAPGCSGASTCDASGACKLQLGQPCASGASCASGVCVGGLCCDTACTGSCEACNGADLGWAGAQDGHCAFAPAGFAGAPACNLILCDGASGTCPGACSKDADCAANAYCAASTTCQTRKGDGAPCNAGVGGDCLSPGCRVCATAACADGFCCDAPCSGACDVCAAALGASADGTCTVAGKGATGSPSCAPFVCDGAGAGCPTACATDADCAAQAYCAGGSCMAKGAQGAPCSSAGECQTNLCADGVCCDAPCQGQCEACDVAGAPGSCVPVAGAPHEGHMACPGASPGAPCKAAACDGVDRTTCAGLVGSSVQCRDASCASGTATLAAFCDGKGTCAPLETKACSPFVCDGAQCRTACTADADCAAGYHCDTTAGQCIVGGICDGDHTLKGGAMTQDCSPYRCSPANVCLNACGSSVECVAGFVCTPDGQCVAETPGGAPLPGCACATTDPGPGGGAALLGAGALVVAARRRRARRPAR